jgi:hypothetical protein
LLKGTGFTQPFFTVKHLLYKTGYRQKGAEIAAAGTGLKY